MEELESRQPEQTPVDAETPQAAAAESALEVVEATVAAEETEVEILTTEIVVEGAEDDGSSAEEDAKLRATLEAIVYITDEPLTLQQLAAALGQPIDKLKHVLDELVEEYEKPSHGLSIREVAGGYKMATKAEHHEAVRAFVKKLTPPLKLSLAALETLAVIAYKQPVTAPEIMEIRGVQGAGVLKTLLDRKLIQEGGRKKVVGQPILYKTTKEFLVQFGLKDLGELPTLKEFEELGRMELVEEMADGPVEAAAGEGTISSGAEVAAEAAALAEPSQEATQPEEVDQESTIAETSGTETASDVEASSPEQSSAEEAGEESGETAASSSS